LKKVLEIFLFIFLVSSCEEDKDTLPDGFKIISIDGASYFVLVDEEFWGDRQTQRLVGNSLCKKIYSSTNYCEVYFFASLSDIPKTFPIINRLEPMGIYSIKNKKNRLSALPARNGNNKKNTVILFKEFYRKKWRLKND
jgi:hypothetical protein